MPGMSARRTLWSAPSRRIADELQRAAASVLPADGLTHSLTGNGARPSRSRYRGVPRLGSLRRALRVPMAYPTAAAASCVASAAELIMPFTRSHCAFWCSDRAAAVCRRRALAARLLIAGGQDESQQAEGTGFRHFAVAWPTRAKDRWRGGGCASGAVYMPYLSFPYQLIHPASPVRAEVSRQRLSWAKDGKIKNRWYLDDARLHLRQRHQASSRAERWYFSRVGVSII